MNTNTEITADLSTVEHPATAALLTAPGHRGASLAGWPDRAG
jgi:hypothetical protein